MENKDKRTDVGDIKRDNKTDIVGIDREMNEDTKKDIRTNDMSKDVKKDIKSNNTAELETFIKTLHYPAKKQEIIDTAKKGLSNNKITSALQMIPEKYYSTADELTREIALVT